MKKILSLILCLILAMSVMSGCGNKENNKPVENDKVVTDKVQNETIKNDEAENKEDIEKDNNEDKKEETTNENKKPVVENNKPVVESKPPVKVEKTVSEILKSMISEIPEGQHSLEEIPPEMYKDIYGVDKSQFNDVLIYGAMINVKANEIILIKVNNEADINNAVSVLQARKDMVYKTWERYLPEQFEMVKNGVIKTNGKYAALIISPEVNKVANKFMELTK